jgi:hypothetical protein
VAGTRRQRLGWLAVSALYALLLLGAAILFLLDPGLDAHGKLVGIGAIVGIPAVAYAAGVAPVWRGSRSRAALVGGGAIALVTAVLLTIATFGVGFPLSAILVVVAIADARRAIAVSDLGPRTKLFLITAGVLAVAALLGLLLPVALVAAIVALAMAVRKLGGARRA